MHWSIQNLSFSVRLSVSLCIMQTLFRHCYIIKGSFSPEICTATVRVKLTGDLACSPSFQRYCSFLAAFSWQGSMSQDLMLHRSTVAAQGVCLPFWEMLQVVTKELVTGKRGSVKQRSGRQSKRKEQRQWEWKETDLTVGRVAKEKKSRLSNTFQTLASLTSPHTLQRTWRWKPICRWNTLGGRCGIQGENWSTLRKEIFACQKFLCVMWVVLMSWFRFSMPVTEKGSLLNSLNGCTGSQS